MKNNGDGGEKKEKDAGVKGTGRGACADDAKNRRRKRSKDHRRQWPAVSSAAVSGLSGFSQSTGVFVLRRVPCPLATGTAVCLKGLPVKQRAPPTARHSAK